MPARTAIPLLLNAVLVLGCNSTAVIDDFGFASHALLSGSVTRLGDVPLANGPLFISCGVGAPGSFGVEATTNDAGTFRVALKEPIGPSRASTVVMRCLVTAGVPVFARDSLDVPFSPPAVAPPETVATLVEGP